MPQNRANHFLRQKRWLHLGGLGQSPLLNHQGTRIRSDQHEGLGALNRTRNPSTDMGRAKDCVLQNDNGLLWHRGGRHGIIYRIATNSINQQVVGIAGHATDSSKAAAGIGWNGNAVRFWRKARRTGSKKLRFHATVSPAAASLDGQVDGAPAGFK